MEPNELLTALRQAWKAMNAILRAERPVTNLAEGQARLEELGRGLAIFCYLTEDVAYAQERGTYDEALHLRGVSEGHRLADLLDAKMDRLTEWLEAQPR